MVPRPFHDQRLFRECQSYRRLSFRKALSAGWLDSGDRAYRAGDEFFITGRIKDIVFKAGRNIYPHEIEELASQVDGRPQRLRGGVWRGGRGLRHGAAGDRRGNERTRTGGTPEDRHGHRGEGRDGYRHAARRNRNAGARTAFRKLPAASCRRDQTRQLYLAGKLGDSTRPLWLQVSRLAVAGGARTAGSLLRKALEKLYGVYAALIFIPWLPVAWLALLLAPSRRAAAKVTSFSVRVYLFLIGCRVRVEGRELMTAPGPKVLVSNHTSYFDVLVLMGALGVEYHFVAKKEVHDMPFIGTFLRKLGHFCV